MKYISTYDREVKRKFENLIEVLEIFNSNSIEEVKILLICKIYDSSYKFIKDYIEVYKYYDSDISLIEYSAEFEAVYEALVNYEKLGLIGLDNYFIFDDNYKKNLEFSRMFLNDYIELTINHSEREFLEILGISKKNFDFCVNTVKKMDSEFYEYFLKMKEHNRVLYREKIILTIKDLANGINSGILEDGTEFSLLEFIIRVPFKWEGFFCGAIEKFMKDNKLLEYDIISKYIHDNRLNRKSVFRPLEVGKLYSGDIYVGGYKITNEDNDIILKYMIDNNLPFIIKVYNIIRTKYLNGELNDFDVVNNLGSSYSNKLIKKKYISYCNRIKKS